MLTVGVGMTTRMQRAMAAEMEARMQAEEAAVQAQRAMLAEVQARRQAEEAVRKARMKE